MVPQAQFVALSALGLPYNGPMAVDILQVVHVNINCSDLARSTAFYGDLIGLRAQAHTNPSEPQDGAGGRSWEPSGKLVSRSGAS